MINDTDEIPVSFECRGELLQGIMHTHVAATHGVVIVVGGPQTRHGSHRSFVQLARELVKNRINVLRFDYRGAGDSSGNVQAFTQTAEDIASAVDFFRHQFPNIIHLSLWGLCDAASAIAMYLQQPATVKVQQVTLVNPWVKSTAIEAKTYIKFYYVQRLLSFSFWKKFLSGGVNVKQSASDLAKFQQNARGDSEQHFVQMMLSGLLNFSGNIDVILSENDLTAQEFSQLIETSSGWKKLKFHSICQIKEANHTFASPTWKKQLVNLSKHAIISS